MYLKKEIIISFFYNNYICYKSLYAHDMVKCFLLDFLIPFLCDPDLQCAPSGASDQGVWDVYTCIFSWWFQ
jgi:hypothetical protein